ncbi:serine protease [Paracoccus subflavus]|uniref:Serine protease n=1 Tax=Paracoccus subflavus TaxID=2528244 RepID=A0A4Q9G4U7_9RHOB|nr:serine protease [Paracoccus subflavus]TBN39824.1 serine protease [Paracoccus subflavus]
MNEMTTAELLLYTTVKLSLTKHGQNVGSGTGFFFNFAVDGNIYAPGVVTNKHVIAGADTVTANCHLTESSVLCGKFLPCHMAIREGSYILHPDPNVDLCAIFFGPIKEEAKSKGLEIFWPGISFELIPEEHDWDYFDAIEDVLMIGCPRGIYDEANNLPIIRRGITASSLAKKYQGKNEFMVDMACFPGSSGSPIFLYDRNGYHDRKTKSYSIGASRLKLVGILFSGPLIQNDGSIILAEPPKIYINSMMHLGNAIRSSELRIIDKEVRKKFGTLSSPSTEFGAPIK